MTTKRRPRVEQPVDRAGTPVPPTKVVRESLQHQATLCEWIDTVAHRMAPIKEEIAGIGALVRQHNHSRARHIELGLDTPEFVAASKAVFAILHVADRAAELNEEVGAAAERRDRAEHRLNEAHDRWDAEQARSEEVAASRWPPWGKAQRVQAQWVATQRAATEVTALRAALEEANDEFQPLAAEADLLDIELGAFRRVNGGTPEEVYQRVEEHRQAVKAARAEMATIESEIRERRDALELQLRSHLRRAQQWGLISVIPDGAEAMADALQQTRDVAMLETSQVDCEEVKDQVAAAPLRRTV